MIYSKRVHFFLWRIVILFHRGLFHRGLFHWDFLRFL